MNLYGCISAHGRTKGTPGGLSMVVWDHPDIGKCVPDALY